MKFSDVEMKTMDKPYDGVQAMLEFGEHKLSIVKHSRSYGGAQGLYEIAVFSGNDQIEMPGITEQGNTIKGFLQEYEVDAIIKKMVAATGNDPVQV